MVHPKIKFWGAQIIVWLLSILLLSNIIGAYADPTYLQRDYLFIFKGQLTGTQIAAFGIFYLVSMAALPYVTQTIADQRENTLVRFGFIFSYPIIYFFLTLVGMKSMGLSLEKILDISLVHFWTMFFVFWSVCILIYVIEVRYLLESKLKNLRKIEATFEKNWPFSKKGS